MYVVAGATGQTGKAVAEALLAAGKNVTGSGAERREDFRLEGEGVLWIAVVDLGDEKALSRTLAGADGAYLLIPPDYAASDYLADRGRLARSIGRAVSSSGVPHVVLLSSTGGHRPEGTGMILAPRAGEEAIVPAARARDRTEGRIFPRELRRRSSGPQGTTACFRASSPSIGRSRRSRRRTSGESPPRRSSTPRRAGG